MRLASYAKLNLFLLVRGKRPDGYHSLQTLFERISLHDTIGLTIREDRRISLSCDHPGVPLDASNLALRSAAALQRRLKIPRGVHIAITKRIPVGSGMAGGSSNAATVLVGLNRLWKAGLNRQQLCRLAGKIGSDVPFFIHDCPFALAAGRGERVRPLTELKRICLWHIVIMPRIHVATPKIYQGWDDSPSLRLTKPKISAKLLCLALQHQEWQSVSHGLYNSLEPVTSRLYPEVNRIRKRLQGLGVQSILMSGSGPAVFGVFRSRKEAETARRKLSATSRTWQVATARTK